MTSSAMRGVRRGGWLLAAGIIMTMGQAAHAQAPLSSRLPPGAIVQPLEDSAGSEQRRSLTTLAANPQSVSALIGAGRSAIAVGDGAAALSFFGRADEIEPRNPRVKAGMASALVLLERGGQALVLFREAEALGAPAMEIARDRGLAYDMTGDPRRAQQDYAAVLARGDDPEVRRRLALSLAISGRREEALEVIAAQLRAQDRSAWRTQAFVLALTGDIEGAERTAERMMPGGRAMAPFLARLAALSPAQKAMAVHFGSFPSDGRALASGGIDTSADPAALALAQGGRAPPRATAPRPTERPATIARTAPRRPAPSPDRDLVDRRRPGSLLAATTPRPNPTRRVRPDPEAAGPIAPAVRRPVETAEREIRRFEPPPTPEPEPEPVRQAFAEPETQPEPAGTESVEVRETLLADGSTLVVPGFSLAPGGEQPRLAQSEPEPETAEPEDDTPDPVVSEPAAEPARSSAASGLGDLNSVLAEIEDGPAPPAPTPARTSVRTAEARPAPARAAARRPAPPAQPSRRWVQIATVPDRAALAREFSRLRTRAPDALRGRGAYSAPFGRSSSRLLVGPFDTARAAQDVITQLGRAQVSAFAWTSEAGQEIGRVQTANDSRSAPSRSQPEQRTPARRAGARAGQPARTAPAARPSRGRAQPEPRSSSRRGRSNQ